jgi:hypothetical protein
MTCDIHPLIKFTTSSHQLQVFVYLPYLFQLEAVYTT